MKTVLILTDGMADEPLAELKGKTPLEYAQTPNMDAIAREGACGTFLSLPEGYPTSSDVANMSVMGYDPAEYYSGRGPLEAVSQGIELAEDDIAWRCNLIQTDRDILVDYSGGHIESEDARRLIEDLATKFSSVNYTFYPGVSFRNILVLHGDQFSARVLYEKPDDSQGKEWPNLLLKPGNEDAQSLKTVRLLNDLMQNSRSFLANHPINRSRKHPANMIWLWSPGRKPQFPSFSEKYNGTKGAIISAVDVIFGLGICAGMDIIHVPGATGFVDTNYEGKADAAVKAVEKFDFVYVHIEAADECSHMGDLDLKIQAIEDMDKRVIGRIRKQLSGQEITYAVLPDHPVPIRLRTHTRDPVPFAISGPHIEKDACEIFSENVAKEGNLGFLKGDEFMKLVLNCR